MSIDFGVVRRNVASTIRTTEPNAEGMLEADKLIEIIEKQALEISMKCLQEYHKQLSEQN